jgi:DNA-binding winged helix-turn-helix (wHTH) protein/tetratricopeptide (TPR) repeat protein
MESTSSPPMFKFGPFVVDLRAGEVRKHGAKIRMQEKSLRVLAALAEQQGKVVTREELRKRLWHDDTFVDFETGLNTAVSKLREALSDDPDKPRYIETIPKRGYRFLVPVEPTNGHRSGLENMDGSAGPVTALPAAEPGRPGSAGLELGSAPEAKPAAHTSLWALLAVAVAILSGAAYWLTHGHPAFSFRSRDSVLIGDFENQTGDPRFDNALGTAFTVSIEQSRYANVFPRTQLDAVLTRMEKPLTDRITPALGREVCQRENIRGLIAIGITRAGQEYALTAQLIDPQTGESVRSYTERSYGEDHILEALDVLAKEIREALGESLYEIHLAAKPLPQVTTRSLSALQQYAEGSALWLHGRYKDAGTLFKSAVAGDPDFAMAHAALGNAYYSFIYHQPDDGQKEYEKALSLLTRTTDRERMIIETEYAANRGHASDADLLYRAYFSHYPDDAVMLFNYANLLRFHGRQQESIERYNQALHIMPDFGHAYVGLATAYKSIDQYPEALKAYSKAFEIEPQWLTAGNVNREYGFALVANGEDQKAEQVFSALLDEPETRENGLRSLAFLDLYRGRYESAQSRLKQSLEIVSASHAPVSVARVHLLLAIVAEGKGDVKAERENLDAALGLLQAIQLKVVIGGMLGDAFARAGMPDRARQIDEMIKPLADPMNSEQMGYVHLLEGDIALATGKNDEAIELLTESDKENSTAFSSEAIARAYQKTGDADKAIAAYEKMFSSNDRALSWEPQQRWLEARYTLASDYAARGDRQKARVMLEKLLNLWKDADPNLPLLKQAKAEYAKLQ